MSLLLFSLRSLDSKVWVLLNVMFHLWSLNLQECAVPLNLCDLSVEFGVKFGKILAVFSLHLDLNIDVVSCCRFICGVWTCCKVKYAAVALYLAVFMVEPGLSGRCTEMLLLLNLFSLRSLEFKQCKVQQGVAVASKYIVLPSESALGGRCSNIALDSAILWVV